MVTDFCRRYSIGDPAKSSFGRIDGEEKEVVREKRKKGCGQFQIETVHNYFQELESTLTGKLWPFRSKLRQSAMELGIYKGRHVSVLQEIFPTQGSNPSLVMFPALAGRFSTTEPAGKPQMKTNL